MRTRRARTLSLAPLALAWLLGACAARRQAGTGDVAFRLVWDGQSDLDLLVADPAGECIFFGHRQSESGGILDVDCNAGTHRMCARPVENVFWPTGQAPPGPYRFWVHAHALVPAEAPLRFALQLLRGTDVAWVHQGALREHEELLGPFRLSLPGGEVSRVAPDAPDAALPEGCRGGWRGVMVPEGDRRRGDEPWRD